MLQLICLNPLLATRRSGYGIKHVLLSAHEFSVGDSPQLAPPDRGSPIDRYSGARGVPRAKEVVAGAGHPLPPRAEAFGSQERVVEGAWNLHVVWRMGRLIRHTAAR